MEMIAARGLTKKYGRLTAVDRVSFSVKKGEIFGFVGLNGAGKTTTIRMLLGLVKATAGSSYLAGRRVGGQAAIDWNRVGYMVEAPHAYPELTVAENLDVFCRLRGLAPSRAGKIMEHLDLAPYAQRKAGRLSLGNAQRLGMAKALMHEPQILILDEPSNGLDPAGIRDMRQLLKQMAAAGVAILISSHKLDELARLATHIGIIHRGRLIRKIDCRQLQAELKKALLVDGRDRPAMRRALGRAGYRLPETDPEDTGPLVLDQEEAIRAPEEIAKLLVEAGQAPTLLRLWQEDLETFFLRSIAKEERP